jgi:hypothetical protein
MTADEHKRIFVLAKRMKWFMDNRYDIGRANISDDLMLIESEVEKVERTGVLSVDALERIEAVIKRMEEQHKPEDAWLWD